MCIFPENDLPLSSHRYLFAQDPLEAEKYLAKDIERRQFFAARKTDSSAIYGNRFDLGAVQIYCLQFDAPLQVRSEQLKSVNMIFPLSGRLSTIKERSSITMTPGCARIDSPGDILDLEWLTHCQFVVVRIPEETLYSYCRRLYDCDAAKGVSFEKLMSTQAGPGTSVNNILHTILKEADTPESLLNQGRLTQSFEETLVMSVLQAQPHSLSQLQQQRACKPRPAYIKRAVEYIQENAAEDITLSILAETSGVSVRSLQAGFSRIYGVGPKTYIKHVKLHKTREDLIAADPSVINVVDVAVKWGFYNACNFSVNYRKLFGEAPSETLRAVKGI